MTFGLAQRLERSRFDRCKTVDMIPRKIVELQHVRQQAAPGNVSTGEYREGIGLTGPTEALQKVARPEDVRGSRLLTHLILANAKFDEYAFNSGHIVKRLPSRRWDRERLHG